MIFEFLYRKQIRNYKEQLEGLYSEIRSLKSELAKANETIDSKQKRFERITYLLNDRVAANTDCKIEVTKKGVFVLTATKVEEFGVEVFDLDGVSSKSDKWALALWAYHRGDHYFIQDIPGGRGRGHGENAMRILLAHIEKLNKENEGKQQIKYIIGDLSVSDKHFRDSQKAFYEKMGFTYNLENMRVTKKLL